MSEEKLTLDAFSNPLFRLGYGSQSPLEATEYPLTRMTGNYALLNALYRENWVVQNVVGIIPDDMTRNWFTLGGVGPEHRRALEQVQRRTALRDRINMGLKWGRLYGGAAGILLLRGQEGLLDRPLDLETVLPGTFAGVYIVDRWCGITPCAELVTDTGDPDFGLPAYYEVNRPQGGAAARIHHSRIIRFTGRELPYLEKLAEQYWGESEVEALYQDVVKHDNVSANMAALTFRANVDTLEVENLDQLFSFSSLGQQRRFWNTMQAQSVMQSNFGTRLVNKGDQLRNTQYTFSGLQEVYDSMCLDLSGASRIPVTKLFGRAPAGLNATGESDLRNYYDYVDTLRENVLKPILERILPVVCMSAWGAAPEDFELVFPPLWTPTAKETAEIAKSKAEAIAAVFQSGLLRADTAQKELKKLADETGLFGSITDEEIAANAGKTFMDVTALQDPLAGLTYEEAPDAWFDEGLPERELRRLIDCFLQAETDIINEIDRLRTLGLVDYHAEAALARVQAILHKLENDCWTYVPRMIETNFYVKHPDARKPLAVPETPAKHLLGYQNALALTGEQMDIVQRLTNNAVGQLAEASATVQLNLESMLLGRVEPDVFRRAGLTQAASMQATGQGVWKALPKFVEQLRREGVTAFVDRAGRHWNLHTYGGMVLRTTSRQAEVLSVLTENPEHDLYQISSHGTTCPLCAPLEGRVYSKSGQDPDFPPLSAAFGKMDKDGPDTLDNSWLNIHPNCLHQLLRWTPMGRTEEEIRKIKEFSSFEKNPPTRDPRSQKQIDAYRQKEQARARYLRDYKQWEKYRAKLGDKVPKTFETFRKHKYAVQDPKTKKFKGDEKYQTWRNEFRRANRVSGTKSQN